MTPTPQEQSAMTDTTQADREAQAREVLAQFCERDNHVATARFLRSMKPLCALDGSRACIDAMLAFATPPAGIDDAPEPAVPVGMMLVPPLNPPYAEEHPLLAPIIEKRSRAARNFEPEFMGQRGQDFDRGLMCAFEAVNGALQRMTARATSATPIAGGAGIDDDPPGDMTADFAPLPPETYAEPFMPDVRHGAPPPVQAGEVERALDALKWANERLRECGKQVDFTLGMCMTLSDSEKRADALANYLAALPTPVSQPIEDHIRAEEDVWDWFGSQRRLSLYFYSPMRCDDDDQTQEWRVDQESGSINDREWETVGRGLSPYAAVSDAAAALRQSGAERGETA